MRLYLYCLLYLGNLIFFSNLFAQHSNSVVDTNPSICFLEDFSSITTGNNNDPNNSGTTWNLNSNFSSGTKVYQAGGAIRLGTSSEIGSITSRILDDISGNTTLQFDVKGWTEIEGDILVSLGGTTHTISYSATMSSSFESKTLHFANVPINSTLTISTTRRRAFLDNIQLICNNFVGAHTDFYRSRQSGAWNDFHSWESSPTGVEGSFEPAFLIPNAQASSVKILPNHHININSQLVELTNLEIHGVLEISDNATYSVLGDEEIEVKIKNGGSFLVNSNGPDPNFQAKGLVETGGKLVAGPQMSGGTNFGNRYIGINTGFFSFEDASIIEWDTNLTILGSNTTIDRDFFRRTTESALPIFRIITKPAWSFGSSDENVLNCILEVIAPAEFGFRYPGNKTILGGIQGSGLVFQEFDSGNLLLGNAIHEPFLDGTIQLSIQNNKLKISNGLIIKELSAVQIMSNQNQQNDIIQRINGNIEIYGSLDIHNLRIENTEVGGISVHSNGTIKTRHTGGLFGPGSAIVEYAAGKLNLLDGSTVDYYADENQAISSLMNYYHLIFSGSGTKNPNSAISVHTNGSVTINDNAIVNFANHNLGLTTSNNTNFTMNGGRLIIGTGGTQPNMNGDYYLNGGVIEFTGNSAITIRVGNNFNPKKYQNMEISGTNIKAGTSNETGLTFHENGSFKVNDTAVFKVPNLNGFIGTTTSAIKNAEILSNLILEDYSTIEYNSDENSTQTISVLENGYGNLKLTGISTKIQNGKNLLVRNSTEILNGNLIIPTSTDEEMPYVLFAMNGINNIGGNIRFENNAILMQNSGVVNTGEIQMKRNAIVPSIQYNFWSSPVKNQSLYDLYPDIPTNRVMVYNTLTDFYTILPSSSNPTSNFGIGYSIKGSTTMEPNVTATFIGIPHNESIHSSENQIPLSTLGANYNLIGNPFPSNLDLVKLYEENPTQFYNDNTEDTPHYLFWDNTDNDDLIQQGPDYVNQNFALYNPSSMIGIAAPRFGPIGKRPNGIVKPGQGFIIRASESATHLQLSNEMRTIENQRGGEFSEYFRIDWNPDLFYLNLHSPSLQQMEIAIGYFEQAENSFERFDSQLPNPNASEYFFSTSSDEKQLVIHGKKLPFQKTHEIPIGLKISESGTCKIELSETKGIFENMPLFIWDEELKKSHDLQSESYIFSCHKGEFSNRFQIQFRKKNSRPIASDSFASLNLFELYN